MFGLGIQEILILAVLALGAAAVIALVVRSNSSGRERPRGD